MSDQENIYHRTKRYQTAILLVNLGTPRKLSYFAIQRFLQLFLSDKRVIKLSRWLWYPILYGFILPLRPFKTKSAYAAVWHEDGPPLLLLSEKLRQQMAALSPDTPVCLAMRYGEPSMEKALASLAKHPIRKLVILPLFPQYSASTTASVFDELARLMKKREFLWDMHFISGYHHKSAWIIWLKNHILAYWQKHGKSDHLVISYHGLPASSLTDGDPYACFCHQTTRLLQEALELPPEAISTCFQSRFGPKAWLQPYADDHLKALAQKHPNIDLICPGFAVDCLETLEEVQIGYAELFHTCQGGTLRYIPCGNANPEHAQSLLDLALE